MSCTVLLLWTQCRVYDVGRRVHSVDEVVSRHCYRVHSGSDVGSRRCGRVHGIDKVVSRHCCRVHSVSDVGNRQSHRVHSIDEVGGRQCRRVPRSTTPSFLLPLPLRQCRRCVLSRLTSGSTGTIYGHQMPKLAM